MNKSSKIAKTSSSTTYFRYLGYILIIFAVWVLVFGEQHANKKYRALAESAIIAISVSNDTINPKNNNHLIHISGQANTTQTLKDPDFGIKLKNTLKLHRKVLTYQWKEKQMLPVIKKEKQNEVTTTSTYKYTKIWSEKIINSNHFQDPKKYKNPIKQSIASMEFVAHPIKIGKFQLGKVFINQIKEKWEPLVLTPAEANAINKDYQSKLKLSGSTYYSGNPQQPQIGDIKIQFNSIPSEPLSLIGKQDNQTITTYSNLKLVPDGPIALLSYGRVSKHSQFILDTYKAGIPWKDRLAGLIIMFIGVICIFYPLYKQFPTNPKFKSLRHTSLPLFIIFVVVLSALISSLSIAFYWSFIKTIITLFVFILVILLLCLYILKYSNKKAKTNIIK